MQLARRRPERVSMPRQFCNHTAKVASHDAATIEKRTHSVLASDCNTPAPSSSKPESKIQDAL